MSSCDRWTVIPDVSDPGSLHDWHHGELSEPHRKILLSLFLAQPSSVDALGSTDALARMAATFSALTGVPTLPATLFAALVGLRKAGLIQPRRRRTSDLNVVKLAPAPSPEVPA